MSAFRNVNDIFKIYTLLQETELRVTMGKRPVQLKLLSGDAEIQGTELVVRQVYDFRKHTCIAAYTWHGCSIKVIGTPVSVKVVMDPPMAHCVLLHRMLEQRRSISESEGTNGPITLVVGPTGSGKITLCRRLLNYAVRRGRRPRYIDLDVGQNSISIPGTIGVRHIARTSDVVPIFNRNDDIYYFGYKSPRHNIVLYLLLLKNLAQTLELRLRLEDHTTKSSGIIINSGGWVFGNGYTAIAQAALIFKVDKVCVLADEHLYSKFHQDMAPGIEVLFFPNLDGVFEMSKPIKAEIRKARVREYFYDTIDIGQPYMFDVNFDDIQLVKVYPGEDLETIGYAPITVNTVILKTMTLGRYLIGKVLALSTAETVTDDIMLKSIFGFLCVTYVDIIRRTIHVYTPMTSPLPGKILLMGDILLSGIPRYS